MVWDHAGKELVISVNLLFCVQDQHFLTRRKLQNLWCSKRTKDIELLSSYHMYVFIGFFFALIGLRFSFQGTYEYVNFGA